MMRLLRIGIMFLCFTDVFYLSAKTLDRSDSLKAKVNSPASSTEIYRSFGALLNQNELIVRDPILVPEIHFSDSIIEKKNRALMLQEKVQTAQRFLESLDKLSEIDLPIGVVKSGGALDYSILIDRINFTPRGAVMEVYVSLALPQNGHRITFNGKVPLSKEGGLAGTAKIFLVGDEPIKINNNTLLTIKATPNTFVAFDCSGFAGVSIEAEGEFSKELVIPENGDGSPNESDRVKFQFVTYVQSLNDLMVSISLPPFQITGLKGIGFSVNQATIDWSDLANPAGLAFPQGYTSPFTDQPNLWQGFFLQRLDIRLPPAFSGKEKGTRVMLGAERMVLDDQGFSGVVFAENILPDGNMNGWTYTIDRLNLEVAANQPKVFSLTGSLAVPVVKSEKGEPAKFTYTAQRGADGNLLFAVKLNEKVKLPLWAADAAITAGSSVIVKEKDNQFYPSAILNGTLTINALSNGPAVSFNSIRFERMIISSEAPYFQPGSFGFGSENQNSETAGYPVVIRNIGVRSDNNKAGIAFDLMINIGGKPEEEGFGGTASVVVWAKQQTSLSPEGKSTQGDWTFDKVELSGVGINIKKPNVYELAGSINFFEGDATYGKGFKGILRGNLQKIEVQADALFGKTTDFRYWYADALVGIKNGVPIMPGLSAYGFGGGYYYKMKQSAESTATGKTRSGIIYTPDQNISGIKAMMLIGTAGKPDPFNGAVTLEVVINRSGGINSVNLKGSAQFMAPLSDNPEKVIGENAKKTIQNTTIDRFSNLVSGQVFGSVNLQFDNVNDVIHGNLEIYVNVAGGIVRGVSSGNKAGWATIHFAQNDWYILIGTPDQPIGLEVARIFKSKSYIMMGKNLPGSPPPPEQVSQILGNVNLGYTRDMNALQSGTGFAFGLSFIVDTGDLNFLMFYGRFAAGTGLDFMLKDYGTAMQCAETGSSVGINGWYANGQAYAFVQGKIGVKVNLKFYKGNYDILSLGAAAILQAKGPNPFWMKGTVGGYYKILGGLIKGTCKFDVTIGKECTLVGEQNLLADAGIISSISPGRHASDVSVFNTPQVAFNIPVNQEFEIADFQTRKHTFRATLNSFALYDGTTPLTGALKWNEDQTVVVFDGRDILPGEKELTARAQITFEEKINGTWSKAIVDGQTIEEKAETTFKTGVAPDFIPSENVALSYPLNGQVNFYPNEYNQGFIQLKDGQPYLFNSGAEWIQKIRMTAGASYAESDLSYNESDRKINFTIPANLKNSQTYSFEILNIPRQSTMIDANVTRVATEVQQSAGVSTTVTTAKIEGQLDQLEVKKIYSSGFRTSKYNTFLAKVNSMNLSQTFRLNVENAYLRLVGQLAGDEPFDATETNGLMNSERLVSVEAVLDDNSWYQNLVYPLVYEGYPLMGVAQLTWRNPEPLGIPPVRSVIINGQNIEYNLMQTMLFDFRDIQYRAINYTIDHQTARTSRVNDLAVKNFPVIRYGPYKVKMSYRIPGMNTITSTKEWQLFNPVRDN